MLGTVPYFVLFPDTEARSGALRRLMDHDSDVQVIRHPSGRPMMAGRWGDDVRYAVAGSSCLVVAGLCAADDDELRSHAHRLSDDERAEPGLPWAGAYHLITSVRGVLRARGAAYGVVRLFHTEVDGVEVSADRAAILARFAGLHVDPAAMAARMISLLPHPLTDMPLWSGIRNVPNGSRLRLGPDGREWSYESWHRPPEPHLTLAEGAGNVRAALDEAVALRVRGARMMSSDLSGGLDSTSVSFLAAGRVAADRHLLTTVADDPERSDDLRWARRAASHLPGRQHLVIQGADLPAFYADVADGDDDFDEPTDVVAGRGRVLAAARQTAPRGATVHLTGYGGDHLFLGNPAHYHSELLRHPWISLQRLRGYRALFNWRWRHLLPELCRRRPYHQALSGLDLRSSVPATLATVRMDWLYPVRVPDWLTDEAVELVAERMAAAGAAEPLAPTPGRHSDLFGIDNGTRHMRALSDLFRQLGVTLGAPYFDDRVIDAALSVRITDRVTPFAYKRLLAEAMRPVLPAESLTRRTKAHATPVGPIGLRRHRAQLLEIFSDSALERFGLIDAERVRHLCTTPDTRALGDSALQPTLGAEIWLTNVLRRQGSNV